MPATESGYAKVSSAGELERGRRPCRGERANRRYTLPLRGEFLYGNTGPFSQTRNLALAKKNGG